MKVIKKQDAQDAIVKSEEPAATGPDPAAAALADLEKQAHASNQQAEQEQQREQDRQQQAQVDAIERDLFDVLKMVQAVAKPRMWWLTEGEFDGLWGDPTLKAMAGPGAEIMRRNGWSTAAVMEKYGPYIALAMAVGPPAITTVQAYKVATREKPAPVKGSTDVP